MCRYLFITLLIGICGNVAHSQAIAGREEPILLRTVDCDIQGSLLIPESEKPVSVVLIISDSGPTDRNGNQTMMLNNSLKMYAVSLALSNIASLRYDKRGVAASKMVNYDQGKQSLPTYIDDVKGWIRLLKKDSRFSNIIVAGHSEGALIGLAAISDSLSVDGYISLAGMGQTFDVLLKDRFADYPTQVRDLVYTIVDSMKVGKVTHNVPVFLKNSFSPPLQKYFMTIFDYNPQQMIRDLNIPILLLQGDKDLQVKVEDAKMLSIANPKAKMVVIKNMNHVFKECKTMDRQEQLETLINPSFPLMPKLVEESVMFIRALK